MAQVGLYVRSNKTELPSGSVFVDALGTGPQTLPGKTTQIVLPRNDALGRDMLKKFSAEFELVDLSRRIRGKLSAKLQHVKQTPTLIVDSNPPDKYEDVTAISQYLAKNRN
jgi:hypothetical protein